MLNSNYLINNDICNNNVNTNSVNVLKRNNFDYDTILIEEKRTSLNIHDYDPHELMEIFVENNVGYTIKTNEQYYKPEIKSKESFDLNDEEIEILTQKNIKKYEKYEQIRYMQEKKSKRSKKSDYQIEVLNNYLKLYPKWDKSVIERIAKETKLSFNQIYKWKWDNGLIF